MCNLQLAFRLAADESCLQLLAADGKCAVSVTAPASTAWAADVDLGADLGAVAVVKGLLVHMQRAGMLRKVEAPPPEVRATNIPATKAYLCGNATAQIRPC